MSDPTGPVVPPPQPQLPQQSPAQLPPQPPAAPQPQFPAQPQAAPQPQGRSPLSDGEWHRLHPLTPLLRGGLVLVVVIGVIIANLRDRVLQFVLPIFAPDIPSEGFDYEGDPVDWVVSNNLILVAMLAVLVLLLLVIAGFYLSWRFHTFRITRDEVEVRSGILFRTHRKAKLDRVQGVNLTRPMVARLLGTAKLEVVGAGTDGNVKLEYLSTSNAEQVRADILRLASGRQLDAPTTAVELSRAGAISAAVSHGVNGLIVGEDVGEVEAASVVNIPVARLLLSHVLSVSTVFFVLAIIAVFIGAAVGSWWVLFAIVPGVLGFGAYWVSSIFKALRYSIAPTRNGVRITFGLLTTITEIIPPGRVHAIEIRQSILWRPAGWWSVKINRITGKSATDTTTDQFTTVLPVGTRADVERVLGLLMPDVTPHSWSLVFENGVLGSKQNDPFTNTPRRARIIRPFSWRRNGFAITDDAILVRRGVVWRSLAMFPFARLQSIGLEQGPVDRKLGVAGVRVHTVLGPVTGHLAAVDRDAALWLLNETTRRAVHAASSDRTHRWASDASAAPAAAPAPEFPPTAAPSSAPTSAPPAAPTSASTSAPASAPTAAPTGDSPQR